MRIVEELGLAQWDHRHLSWLCLAVMLTDLGLMHRCSVDCGGVLIGADIESFPAGGVFLGAIWAFFFGLANFVLKC